jgi:hypothetical protein
LVGAQLKRRLLVHGIPPFSQAHQRQCPVADTVDRGTGRTSNAAFQDPLFTVLSQLIERAELVLSRPTDEKLRIELDAQLNTADWPFVVDNGGDDSIKVKVDEARSAAQIVRVHLSAAPLAYRAALEQLVDALRTLKRELDL